MLEMPQNMYNSHRVRSSDSLSCLCSPSPHLYTGCAPEGTGDLLIAFKRDWQKCPCNQTNRPCLPGHLFPSTPADLSWALLTFTRHTSGNRCFPSPCFFLLPESLLMTSSLWGLNRLSSLSSTRSVPKLTLLSLDWIHRYAHFPSLAIWEAAKMLLQVSKKEWKDLMEVNGSWVRCELWIKWSQQPASWKSAETQNGMHKVQTEE